MELDSGEHKQICKECPHKEMERCKCENHERFYGSCFRHGINQEEFTNYWSTSQSMNTPWFCMFSRDHFRKTLGAFHIVDNSIIPEGMIPCID